MRVIRTEKQLKEVEVVTENYYQCDKCNNRIKSRIYDAFSFDFEYVTGDSYPDGGSGERTTLDLCANCAEDLMELLKTNGYRLNKSEWNT